MGRGTTGTSPGGAGRFEGYDVLGQVPTWDDVTKGVVLRRLGPPPPLRFFPVEEEAVGRPLLDRLLAQDDEPRIPVFEMIDPRLAEGMGDGWRHEDMPEDGEAWRRSLRALESRARQGGGRPFSELDRDTQIKVHDQGIPRVKIKVGEARVFSDAGVRWFEEPVSSDDLEGLRVVRDSTDLDVAAGEYGYDLVYLERMAGAGAVDVLQIDASRCAGITEWLRAAAVAAAHGLDVSAHTAQSLHAHPACSIQRLRHLEYFADHARVDRLLFDGVLEPTGGVLRPDGSRPGLGLELRRRDAERYREA